MRFDVYQSQECAHLHYNKSFRFGLEQQLWSFTENF